MVVLTQKPLHTLNSRTSGFTNANKNRKKTPKQPNFQGNDPKIFGVKLDTIAQKGADPGFSTLMSTIGILAARPAITMMDKSTPLDQRVYSASWQAGIALAGLAVQLPFYKKIVKASNFVAQKIQGVKLGKDIDLINKPALLEAVLHNNKKGPQLNKILEMTPEQGKKLAVAIDAKIAQRGNQAFKSLRGNKKLGIPANPFIKSPALIEDVINNKKLVQRLLKDKAASAAKGVPSLAEKALNVSGTSKVVGFLALMGTLNFVTGLVTKYMDPSMKFLGNKFNIKAFKNAAGGEGEGKKKNTDEPFKPTTFDKAVFGTIGALTALVGANNIGRAMGKGALGDKAVNKAFNSLNKKLKIGEKIDKVTEPALKKLRNTGLIKSTMAKQANVNDKWVERSVITNLGLRLAITVPTGQIYNTVRLAVDELMNLTFLNAADKVLIKPMTRKLAKAKKVAPYNEGVKVMVDQGVKNFGIVAVAMGFANNAVSGRAIKFIKKHFNKDQNDNNKIDKQEKDYQQFRQQFIAASSINNGMDPKKAIDYKSLMKPIQDTTLTIKKKNEIIFSDFVKTLNRQQEPEKAKAVS